MFISDDVNNFSDFTGINPDTTNGIIPEVDVKNLLIFTASSESLPVEIARLNDLGNMILTQDSPVYEPIGDVSTDPSVDSLTGEAIGQAINQAVVEGHQYLHEFATAPDFEAKMDLVFGENWDKEANISLPAIGVISSAEINGANGAFAEATNTIYLSEEFLAQNLGNIEEVTDVWLEEFGHYIDSRINIVDTQGDEGEILSAVVQGKDLSESYLAGARGEDDTAVVRIDGETLKIEKDDSFEAAWDLGTLNGTNGLNDYFSNGDANDYSRFYLPNTSNVNITLSGLSEDIDVQLLRDDGSFVDQSILGGDSDELISQVLDAGTYYVRVYPAFGSANSNYSLSLSAGAITEVGTQYVETNLGQVNTSPVEQMRPYVFGGLGTADDTLWEIAESQLGNPYRWTEIRKSDGSTYTEEEARRIPPLTTVYLPTDETQTYSEPVETNLGQVNTSPVEQMRSYVFGGLGTADDSLWEIAERQLGNPYRWTEIRKSDGSTYTEEEAGRIPPLTTVYLPTDGTQTYSEPVNIGNNSTGTTVEVTTEGGSETDYSGGVEFIEMFAEPDSREVDITPTIQLVEQDWPDSYPDSYKVTLDRIGGQGYIQNNLETWIVIHGWNDSAGSFVALADAIEEYGDGSRQVLTLDWSGMAGTGQDDYLDLHDAAVWIEEVAETAAAQLNGLYLDPNNINLVGHSLGAYVAYEISEQLGGVNNLVALDPALMTGFPTITGITGDGGYSIDEVDFSNHSQWSWSLESSLAGNDNIARTADESFRVNLGLTIPEEAHGAVKDVWKYMLENPSGAISKYFGLEDMNDYEKPWLADDPGFGSDWEAVINARDVYGFGSENSYWVPDTLRETGWVSSFSDFNIQEIPQAS